jgi:hypothetical protein
VIRNPGAREFKKIGAFCIFGGIYFEIISQTPRILDMTGVTAFDVCV